MIECSGNKFWFDAQVGTFMAQVGDVVYGTHSGHLMTAAAIASEAGVTLSTDELAALDAEKALATESGQYVQPTLSKIDFLHRFTPTEQADILTAAKTNIAIESYLFLIQARDRIDLADPSIAMGIYALEQLGVIATGRASVILGL